ncbi:MAG: hypothetical protein ACJ796_14420 [Gemmatimonadaceae bacterium]
MNSTATQWLTLFFRPSLTLAVEQNSPGRTLTADGVRYEPAYAGDLIATYDRLVTSDGRLVGFQVWPVAASTVGIFEALPRFSYLHAHPESHFDILLAPALADQDVVSAGDQSLIGQIYRSDSGEMAIAIDLAELALTAEDLNLIATAAGH